jgi:trans-aconitate methyltransferase
LRKLSARFPHLRGIGLDGFAENIHQATRLAQRDGLSDRLTFMEGDIHQFTISEPVDLIAMNRALHHVWSDKANVFRILHEHLKPGGAAVIWEPNWPQQRAALRDPARRGMAIQNLSEHIQGNHFLRPDEIEAAFHRVGMTTQVYLFANGNEAVVVGRKV